MPAPPQSWSDMHASADPAGVWWMRDNIRSRLKHRKTTRLWLCVRAWAGNIQVFCRSVPSRIATLSRRWSLVALYVFRRFSLSMFDDGTRGPLAFAASWEGLAAAVKRDGAYGGPSDVGRYGFGKVGGARPLGAAHLFPF